MIQTNAEEDVPNYIEIFNVHQLKAVCNSK